LTLSAGARLGPYEILEPLGAGGMGEVYRAKDTRLDRIVAIKVLPAELSANPELRQRLEREAKAVSQLSHPHICTLYDIGREGGSDFLVMEYLEGESLADRLGRGHLPLDQVLRYGSEIAEALHGAHRHGVVHRDLKPGNVMLTKSGAKLLDFGLAKLHETEPGDEAASETSLPTMNSPLTEKGTILGTYPYMAPEQLEGKSTDARTDIFSLGAMLYEMVTGERPFRGDSRASLIAAIMTSQPRPMKELEAVTPPSLDRTVRRCLEKDPEERWQSARDLAAELRWIRDRDEAPVGATSARGRRSGPTTLALAAAAVAIGIAGSLIGWLVGTGQGPEEAQRGWRAQRMTFQEGVEGQPSLSPDGRQVVFVSEATGNLDIYFQRVNGQNAINLTADSEAADSAPTFSPDGEQIAFRSERDGGGIFVMGATGESVRRVADRGYNPSWSPDGRHLVVSTEMVEEPMNREGIAELWVIDVATGATRRLYGGDGVQPAWSPDGRRIAFWGLFDRSGQRDLATIDAGGQEEPTLVTRDAPVDWNPVWSTDGRALYFLSDRGGTMDVWRVSVDPATGRAEGVPRRVGAPAEDVAWLTGARGLPTLAYVSRSAVHALDTLGVDPDRLRLTGERRTVLRGSLPVGYIHPSPNGTRIALTTEGTREDLYVLGVEDGELRRLTDDPFRDRGPQWSPDGSQIAFYSDRSGTYQLWSIRPDGSGLRQLTEVAYRAWYPFWSPDGKRITFPGDGATCVMTVQETPTSSAECLPGLSEGRWFFTLDWSPDGQWLVGNESLLTGRSLPRLLLWSFESGEYRPLAARGLAARWLPDSRHLLVIDESDHLVVVDRTAGQVRDLGPIETKTQRPPDQRMALSRDGRTLVVQTGSVEANVWLLSREGDESEGP